ncbi:adenosylcobinamide-GDP ribazoletransferase [Lentilactobacillus hilgardii]|nr:adenosylcobinamide-GDP ribazoletransferase [Lentilactobacillus hilgardii]TDG80676.1 hypothetical protein C5L34_000877 [Lentilactobacillus hilgardii]
MIQGLILYTQFFTRIRIPVEIKDPGHKFRDNIQYFTLFGLILGCLEAALFLGYTYLFPQWFAWMLFWMTDGMITGGFHLDALADTADGVMSSRTSDKMFKIMKDSRLGTMGTLALIYFYAILFGVGAILAVRFDRFQLTMLVLISVMMAKTGISLLFYKMTYAGEAPGLATIWQGIKTWRIGISQVVSLIAIGVLLGYPGLISYLAVLIVAYGYRRYMLALLGGFSGDTLGGFAEISQVIFLLAYVIVTKLM